MEGANMGSPLTVDIFVSVDGWAGSDGLPGYFGYLGPELETWINTQMAAPQRLVMGRRTYEVLSSNSVCGPGSVSGSDDPIGQGRVLAHVAGGGLAQHTDLRRRSRRGDPEDEG